MEISNSLWRVVIAILLGVAALALIMAFWQKETGSKQVATRFVSALAQNDTRAAYGYLTHKTQAEIGSPANLGSRVLPLLSADKWDIKQNAQDNRLGRVRATVWQGESRNEMTLYCEKEEGVWRIASFRFSP